MEWKQHVKHSSLSPNITMATMNTTPAADVLIYGCVSHFNRIACIRSSLLTFLAVLTTVLCILKLIKFHHAHHQNWHQYFIFYCASIECSIAGVHWVLSMYVQFDFVLQWLKLAQFLVMCHFYWTLAIRALSREMWTKRFLLPFLAIACLYFSTVAVLGIVNVQDTFTECFQPYWIMMSSAEFTIVQLFCVAGFYITRRLNEISMLDSVRRSQKRDLWCIVVVFELSALVGLLYDMTMTIIGDKETGCSAIFKHGQEVFSVIYFSFMVAKLLLPIWVMLCVFQPTPQFRAEADDLIPALTDDGNSAFSTNTDEQYRQLYHPSENYRSLSYDTPTVTVPVYNPASPGRNMNTVVVNGATNNAYKSLQPNLGPINEESISQHQSPMSQTSSVRNRNTHQQNPSVQAPQAKIGNVGSNKDKRSIGGANNGETQKAKIESQSENHQQTGETNQSQNSQSIRNDRQSQKVEPSIDRQAVTAGQAVPGSKENIPSFSITGNSDDSDEESPSPKGKFYI